MKPPIAEQWLSGELGTDINNMMPAPNDINEMLDSYKSNDSDETVDCSQKSLYFPIYKKKFLSFSKFVAHD